MSAVFRSVGDQTPAVFLVARLAAFFFAGALVAFAGALAAFFVAFFTAFFAALRGAAGRRFAGAFFVVFFAAFFAVVFFLAAIVTSLGMLVQV
ncbi:MAG: hypothetical protein JWN04_3768 [Myxococcaceae bacterium]|nr:hypothetical protein [Myxococcaceae bacterium]